MSNSLRIKIKKLCHDGKINVTEQEILLKKLDGHDQEIRADERTKVLTDIYNILEKWRNMQIGEVDCIGEISDYVDIHLDI